MKTINQTLLHSIKDYIQTHQSTYGLSPSYRQIATSLQIKSVSVVHRYVNVLEEQGALHRMHGAGIITPSQLRREKTTLVPLVGEIACGSPSFAVEDIEESYSLPQNLFGSGTLFMLRAKGDSMIEAGINHGDYVVVRQQSYAEEGDIVVALVENETTLKRFYKRGNKIILHPENHEMSDIVLNECLIQGVLVSCIKMY